MKVLEATIKTKDIKGESKNTDSRETRRKSVVSAYTNNKMPQQTHGPSIVSAPIIFDAVFRGLVRYLESSTFSSSVVRLPFRFITETVRYGTGMSIGKLLEGNKIEKEVWITSLRKALENTTATIIFEPNKYNNRFVRMGVGFANMFVRFAARVGLVALNFVTPGEAEIENIADEFLGRSLLRGIYIDSEKPLLGIAGRTIEQLGINAVLAKLPIRNRVIPKLMKG